MACDMRSNSAAINTRDEVKLNELTAVDILLDDTVERNCMRAERI